MTIRCIVACDARACESKADAVDNRGNWAAPAGWKTERRSTEWSEIHTCPKCQENSVPRETMGDYLANLCPTCSGTGRVDFINEKPICPPFASIGYSGPCTACNGTGREGTSADHADHDEAEGEP